MLGDELREILKIFGGWVGGDRLNSSSNFTKKCRANYKVKSYLHLLPSFLQTPLFHWAEDKAGQYYHWTKFWGATRRWLQDAKWSPVPSALILSPLWAPRWRDSPSELRTQWPGCQEAPCCVAEWVLLAGRGHFRPKLGFNPSSWKWGVWGCNESFSTRLL